LIKLFSKSLWVWATPKVLAFHSKPKDSDLGDFIPTPRQAHARLTAIFATAMPLLYSFWSSFFQKACGFGQRPRF